MMKTKELHNGMNVIDSRDVITRIKELEGERESALLADVNVEAYKEENSEEPFVSEAGVSFKPDGWDEEREQEYLKLKALEKAASGSPDWAYGESLIRDNYFEEFAQELAEDIGAIQKNASWPNNHIDWEAAAEALKMDYMAVDFDGETYYIRA